MIRFGSLFLISILFTKSHLTSHQIGLYETFLFIAMAISFFWVSGLIQSFLPLYGVNKSFEKNTARSPEIFNTFILLVLLSLLFGLFLYLFKNSLSALLLDGKEIPYFKYLIFFTIINNPTFLIEHIYLVKNRSSNIVLYGSISYVVQIFLVGCPPLLGYELIWSIYGLLIIAAIRFIWLIVLMSAHAEFKISFPFIKEHISVALPLIISIFLSGSAQYVDGFLITNFYDESKFAIFRYGARELPIVVLIADAFSNAMLPDVSKSNDLKATLKKIKSKSLRYMHILFPVTIVLLAFSNWFYPVVFNKDFSESAKIFNVYLLLIISRLIFPQTILIGLKKNTWILLAAVSELAINIFLSIILLNYLGIIGVAAATVIAFFIEKIILVIVNANHGRKPTEYIPVGWLAFYTILTVIIYFIIDHELLNLF